MTVLEIVKDYLDKNGFDGLCNDTCGCSKNDLFPCDDACLDCIAAYAAPSPRGVIFQAEKPAKEDDL